MRKITAILMCLMILSLPLAAGAEGGGLILTGKVEARDSVTVTAPFGGQVKDFSLRAGDRVSKSDTLMTLNTIKVYAPSDGTVRGIFAQIGDTASFVQSQYGGLCYIEPENELIVRSAASQGYDSAENRIIHLGETVYLDTTNNNDHEGVGRIISLEGDAYVVEITEGSLELRDNVNIFRDEEYDGESRIGRGNVERTGAIAVSGEGSVLYVAVKDGDSVKRGDLLFEMVSGTLDGLMTTSASVRAPQDAIVTGIAVTAGQNVAKDQPMATLARMDKLQLVCSVSEIDMAKVKAGDTVRVTYDGISGESDGTVTGISSVGSVSDDYTEYEVYIDLEANDALRLGMSGTAYLD